MLTGDGVRRQRQLDFNRLHVQNLKNIFPKERSFIQPFQLQALHFWFINDDGLNRKSNNYKRFGLCNIVLKMNFVKIMVVMVGQFAAGQNKTEKIMYTCIEWADGMKFGFSLCAASTDETVTLINIAK